MRNTLTFLFILSALLFTCSCKKDTRQASSQTENNAKQVLSYIKSLGYLDEHIVDNGKEYIVEGDILFSKSMKVPSKSSSKIANTEQYYNGTLVNLLHQFTISVSIDPSMVSQNNEINDAVNLWNGVSGDFVGFTVVPSGGAIVVTAAPAGATYCGSAGFPAGGLPFNQVLVNIPVVAGQSYAQRMINVAHELGHCIGFRHTNGDGGVFGTPVPGWGGTDGSSIMNGNSCGVLSTVLSAKDIGAVRALYPIPVSPQNVQVTIGASAFSVNWSSASSVPGDALVGYTVNYNGFSGTGFGGSVPVSTSTFSYVIPGANPSAPGTSKYIRVSIDARYASGAVYGSTLVSWFNSGSGWHQ